MGLLSRILGLSQTRPPADAGCWRYDSPRLEIALSRAPELQANGSAIRIEGRGLPVRVLVLRGPDGGYHAFRNKCTHAGRRLDVPTGQPLLECCSVGRSRFQYDGQCVSGPAKGPIGPLPVKVDGDRLIIELTSADRS
ncbi:MAG: Rieske (2Fe-2S) protein [Thermodesulfobacteriota bacterium]